MKDKSKRLTVVKTETKKPQTSEVVQKVVVPASSSSHAPGFNPNLYLLKSVWDSVFEIKTDVSGQKYIFGKLPVVTKYGITMYADDGNVDIPQLAEGLPYDQRTIWFNPETKQIEVIGGTGGGVADSVLWDNVEGKPSWITNTKPTYSYSEIQGTPDLSGYATTSALNAVSTKLNDFLEGSDTDTVINKWKELETFLSGLSESDNLATILTGKADKSYVDTNFVTIAGTEDVTGLHNFVNGLKIGGLPITKKQDDVVFLDANLVVRGGITMYAENEVDIPSILDSLPIASNTALGIAYFDSTYFSVDSNGMVSLTSAPSSGASSLGELLNVDASIDATASVDRVLYQSAGSNVWSWKPLSEIGGGSSGGGSVSGNYLPLSGGTINGAGDYLYVPLFVNALNNQISGITFKTNGTERGHIGYHYELGMRLHTASTAGIAVSNSDVPIFYTGNGSVKNTILHAGNYSSYALPLTGGTLTGDLTFQNSNVNINSNRLLMSSENSYGKSSWRIYAYGPTVQFVETSNADWCLKLNNDNSINVNNIITSKGTNGRYSEFYYGGIKCYGTTSGGYAVGVSLHDNNGTFKQTIINAYGDGSNFNHIFIGGEYNKPWIKIDASANMLVKGGITMYSDIRKKTILNHVELSLKQIADAPLIEHYYNSDQDKNTHVGSIAQYWASLNDWFCKLDNEGYYTMEIQNCALASAISIARHLEKYETKTDKTIRKMKQRIQELEEEVERLKQN